MPSLAASPPRPAGSALPEIRPTAHSRPSGCVEANHAATPAQNKASHTKVYWERYTGGKWRSVVSLYATLYRNTSTETKYGVRMMYAPGKWRIRAVHQDDDHAKTTSSWRTFSAY